MEMITNKQDTRRQVLKKAAEGTHSFQMLKANALYLGVRTGTSDEQRAEFEHNVASKWVEGYGRKQVAKNYPKGLPNKAVDPKFYDDLKVPDLLKSKGKLDSVVGLLDTVRGGDASFESFYKAYRAFKENLGFYADYLEELRFQFSNMCVLMDIDESTAGPEYIKKMSTDQMDRAGCECGAVKRMGRQVRRHSEQNGKRASLDFEPIRGVQHRTSE